MNQYASNWSGAFSRCIDLRISACPSAKECLTHWARIATHALYCRFQMLSQSGHQSARIWLVTFALAIVGTCSITAMCWLIWLNWHQNKVTSGSNSEGVRDGRER